MLSKFSARRRAGFTLVELLVVITIIAILASLVLVGAAAARKFVRQGAILTEIDQLSGSLQEYQKKYGAYPPNAIANLPSQQQQLLADLKLHFKQAFPKHQEPDTLFQQLVTLQPPAGSTTTYRGMNAAEAVVFWLGGFSSDARYPVSGKGGPAYDPAIGEDLEGRNFLHSFELSRLGPRNDSGAFAGRVVAYSHPDGSQRVINLWTYRPNGFNQPYVYFDTSRYKPPQPTGSNATDVSKVYDPVSSDGVRALKTQAASGGTQLQFVNPKSFQIMHAGLDDAWGDFTNLPIYPIGPFTEELADNLANFSRGPLENAEQ